MSLWHFVWFIPAALLIMLIAIAVDNYDGS